MTRAAAASPVPRKQRSDQADWQEAMRLVHLRMGREALERRIERTAAEIRENVRGLKVAVAWSGGKDSLALMEVARRAGVEECVLVISELEYPAFLRWATDHMPERLEVVNTGQDLAWLAAHPKMLHDVACPHCPCARCMAPSEAGVGYPPSGGGS